MFYRRIKYRYEFWCVWIKARVHAHERVRIFYSAIKHRYWCLILILRDGKNDCAAYSDQMLFGLRGLYKNKHGPTVLGNSYILMYKKLHSSFPSLCIGGNHWIISEYWAMFWWTSFSNVQEALSCFKISNFLNTLFDLNSVFNHYCNQSRFKPY